MARRSQRCNSTAICGALRRIRDRPSNAVDASVFTPKAVSLVGDVTTHKIESGVGAFQQWDNYDDHSQFPDSPPK